MSNPQPQPRILGLRFFSLTEMVADKTVWSVRFRFARRTIVCRGTKSDAEKADIKNSSEKSVRILSSCRNPIGFRLHNQNIDYTKAPSIQLCFRFFGLRSFSLTEKAADKTVWSVRFRSARRTIVRRGTKSGAEKADINFFGKIR